MMRHELKGTTWTWLNKEWFQKWEAWFFWSDLNSINQGLSPKLAHMLTSCSQFICSSCSIPTYGFPCHFGRISLFKAPFLRMRILPNSLPVEPAALGIFQVELGNAAWQGKRLCVFLNLAVGSFVLRFDFPMISKQLEWDYTYFFVCFVNGVSSSIIGKKKRIYLSTKYFFGRWFILKSIGKISWGIHRQKLI